MNRTARGLCLTIALLVAAGSLPSRLSAQAPPPKIVLAQAEQGERKGIFRFLFKNRRKEKRQQQELLLRREQQEVAPRRERRADPPSRERRREQAKPRKGKREEAKPRKQRRSRPAAEAPKEVAAVEKAADAKRVLVVGDFVAGALAKGLVEAFAQNAGVVVVDANSGDSGLVRADHYDWPTELPGLVETHKPEAIVALIGANDRQPIGTAAGAQALGSDGWRSAYAARAAAFAEALKATTKPVFWIGLGPVKSSAMARDYSAFNNIVREQIESRGMRYVDVWNGFADEAGKFVASGPDISGQPAQLRAGDGINYTRAGQRKLAFFVERDLTELLGGALPEVAETEPQGPAILEPADQPPRIGPMIPLDALLTAGADELSAPSPVQAAERGAAAATITSRLGGAAAPPAGRADDFSLPAIVAPAPTPAAAPSASPPPAGSLPVGAALPPGPLLPPGGSAPGAAPQASALPPPAAAIPAIP